MIFLILFSYVILCDFFPLYDFQCVLNTEEQHSHSNKLLKTIVKQMNSTENKDSSLKYGLQQHSQPTTSEIILVLWMITLFFEEIRQVNKFI